MNSARARLRPWLFFAALTLPTSSPRAEEQGAPPPSMREVSPGVFEIGQMRVDKNQRSVAFPGRVNMTKDLVEYALVTKQGSVHESLLVADIQPSELHFAMLLLGAKGAGQSAPSASQAPPAQIDAQFLQNAPKLKGDNVLVTATWKNKEGAKRTAPIEQWLFNTKTKAPATSGPWIYTGSMFSADGTFLAQQMGVFISLVNNPTALINNPRPGNDLDTIWTVNEKSVPARDTPLTVTVTLQAGISEAQ